jgi:hypothetical protein
MVIVNIQLKSHPNSSLALTFLTTTGPSNIEWLYEGRYAGLIVESGRDIPYGTINLQKFAHFYVLSARYIALSRAI